MTELLTAGQMRDIEQSAIASGEVTGLELMERAGAAVVQAIFEEWPTMGQGAHHALVLCGPGNNGGDGFVVARLLKGGGWDVQVFLYGDADKLPPDAKVNYQRWRGMGDVDRWDDSVIKDRLDGFVPDDPETFEHQLVVDALFGIGLSRETPGDVNRTRQGFVSTVTHYAAERRPKYLAIDIPSGVQSDTGENLGAFPVDLTVTFHQAKRGHMMGEGLRWCGKVVVKDIGL